MASLGSSAPNDRGARARQAVRAHEAESDAKSLLGLVAGSDIAIVTKATVSLRVFFTCNGAREV